MADFHVVLPSNGSPGIYANNTTSHFTIQMPERLELHGRWQVALLEIQYPNTFFNVQKGENWIKVFEDTRQLPEPDPLAPPVFALQSVWDGRSEMEPYWNEIASDEIPPGFYPTSEKLDEALEETLTGFVHLDQEGQFVYKRQLREETHGKLRLFFAPNLALQLGLPATGPVRNHFELKGIRAPDVSLGIPSQMFVYMDIINEQIVGHTRAPLLRSLPVNMEGKFGTMSTYRIDNPIYHDLKTKSFDSIEVNIRTHTGDFMPFHHGTSTLLCHFKKFRD